MVDGLFFNSTSPVRQEAKVARNSVRPVNAVPPTPAVKGQAGASAPAGSFSEALQSVSEHVQSTQRTLNFSVDKMTGSTVVKVIDSDTNKVIRQIPSEEMLVIASRLEAATKGVLLSEQA